jgi:hypothetical protein
MPSTDVEVHFTADTIAKIKKAANVLGHIDMAIVGGENVTVQVFDAKDSSANTYELDLGVNTSGSNFNFVMNIANLKLVDGDYNVFISSKLISEWRNTNLPVNYFIALEKSSTYGV